MKFTSVSSFFSTIPVLAEATMQETSSSTTLTDSDNTITADDLADHLPLHLIESEAVPPSPTRSESTIDWLPDFAGYSWVAYGASSLLVISHFPSPVSDSETLIGSIFRQVFELSSDGSGSVSAVSWSPVTPSMGELAAALDNCIGLFSHNSDASSGSFCWSQNTVLMQSTKVEAIEWTGSGDGIISVGIKVVLWRKKGTSWEIAWNFRPELPQTLVSATWSIEGHSATAPSCKRNAEGSLSAINTASKCVIVYHSDRKSKYVKAELPHPLPVSMIQWRPSTIKQSVQDVRHPPRLLLLTCCVDGTVRLWSEIDDARVRKVGTDINDQRTRRSSFRVCSVIEINHAMNGILGSNIHVRWATQINGIFNIGKEASQYFPSEDYQPDGVYKCEWLIGFGPQRLVTLWSIHCLDDIAPMRYPRVNLWKRQELNGPEVGISSLLLRKVIILRNQVFGPPTVCSLLQLLPCNSLAWFHLNSQTSTSTEESVNKSQAENLLSLCTNGTLNMDSHTGKFLQVAVHSHGCESELAASLDTNGLLLLWSISNISNCIMGLLTFKPTWQLFSKIAVQDSGLIYTSLNWVLAVLDEDPILLAGHVRGVDCFVVKFSKNEQEKVFYHKLCTIPFTNHSCAEGPTNVYSVPLPSTYDGTFVSNTSMLLAVWKNTFQALSWKITMHRCDFSGSCGCNFDVRNTAENNGWTYESNFSGNRYYLIVDPWSSVLPDPHNHNQVTSYAVVSPTNAVLSEEQKGSSVSELRDNCSTYHIATGCFDGSLRLWRSMSSTSSNSDSQWELVGVLDAHQGPITTVSASDCGGKIATIAPAAQSNSCILHVWEAVSHSVAGSFMLEDTIFLDGEVVALNWLSLGNGQLLLGVCLQNQLHVYAQRRCGGQNILNSERSSSRKIWFCVALTHTYPANRDFFWGPKASAVVVHNEYFSLFSPWLLLVNKKSKSQSPSKICNDNPRDCNALDNMFPKIFSDSDICDLKESSAEEKEKHYVPRSPCKMNVKNDILSSIYVENFKQNYNSGIKIGFWSMLDVAEKFGGSLPVYHPEALLMNICSGNWKRAQVALQNLVDYVTSENVSFQRCNLAKSGHVIPLVNLSNYLEGCLSSSSSNKTFQWGGDAALITSSSQLQQGLTQFASSWGSGGSSTSFTSPSTSSQLSGLGKPLEKLYELGAITNSEKMQLLAIIDLVHEVSNPHSASAYESLDEAGRRFWVAIQFQKLYFARRFGRMPSVGELVVDSGMIGWAFHSDCQENLFNSLLPNEPTWHEMRNIGVGFWYTNATQLRSKMEKLARQQYLKNKDPKACALLYIALNRLQVLAGLFKISKDEKDKPLVGFLSRNFQEDKNKAAALKNAYVLMGRHQLELAVAFFLLGGDTSSAINVCAKNLGDEQLALVICRLVESYGGPLQCHLISKFLLPSAIEKGDYWLASYLEWALGNYSQAFMSMLGFQMDTQSNKSALLSNHVSFLDPSIGEYCLMLATSNSMRNALGERNAAILGRWAILMSATALNKCGLPLEGLERLSSSLSISGDSNQGNVSDIANSELLNEMLRPSLNTSSLNWISTDVAFHVELHAKLDMAMQYIIKLLREHPSWTNTNKGSPGAYFGSDIQYQMLLESFHNKLQAGLACFEQKFSLVPLHLIQKIANSLCSNGLVFIGYQILLCHTSKDPSQEIKNAFDGFLLHPILPKILLKATKEMAYLYSRYVIACSISCSHLKACSTESNMPGENGFNWLAGWRFYVQGLIWSLWNLRSTLMLLSGSNAEDFIRIPLIILDLSEYYVYFASAWLQRNLKGLILLVKPILMTCNNGPAHYEINIEDLNKLLPEIAESLAYNSLNDDVRASVQITKLVQPDQDGNMTALIPIDDRWQIIRASLWGHMSDFLKHQLSSSSLTVEDNYENCPASGLSSFVSDSTRVELDNNNMKTQIGHVFAVLTKLIKISCAHISSHCERQLASSLLQKMGNRYSAPTIKLLEEFSQFHHNAHQKPCNQGIDSLNTMNNENELSASEILWNICADPKIVCGGFALNSSKWLQYIKQQPPRRWINLYKSIEREREAEENCNQEAKSGSPFSSNGVGSPVKGPSPDDNICLGSGGKDIAITKKVMPFQIPKEICKRNGELLEALCVNSINQRQTAIASNRKGIIFFNQEDGLPSMDGSNYIWSEVDWPHDGWAGSESTPVPTCVSPGVGLGSQKGTHLGLGGATVGFGSLEKLGRDFTYGGAFGVPGYAGAGSSSLGWEIQDEFEEFVDPPATVENIRTKAFSSHPSKPLFLVGSSNTHIYLWEFGKERATATYGVLPAANVPPPYALASISAVQFDHCGQRFATAALDGTVCTWQLEVGGRSNIRPTESSLCFNNYASDVTYVTASGSIIATAGYSSDAVNVVIWDTLAPPTSSRASIMCHEGGARSLSVFDNDIGSGSISPFIVTGGKGGDVGVHDFRYIATGRTKRHKHSDGIEEVVNGSTTIMRNKIGEQNSNGMLWYIPKAHSGSVTRISAIPNTNFFLTGSKDGDVKLWDAKRAKLVFHWPKLHDRHIFLQGGVVRAAVTDIQVVSNGFLTCGGDGFVKLVQFQDTLLE